ncbi:DUF6090 family protein [Winogradskyella alexanderae]|jgi:hypothetical protein|uniref:Uncharacterized protein n=1 Tax=Winogradskyella alexanderae TaxID=2877123 RepID=A0ABS7XPW5_9FLAO|nr:DUF6090 family protein [Winogradskyella alexanderae]MCA0131076.1 hypothetical protein [Winogradskyella alexanderae]
MIKFFRKIRYELMSENKGGKYFKYAIGEIVLVVVGILIALQINNWNEGKKTKKFEHEILRDIADAIDGNFFQIDLSLRNNQAAVASANIILNALENNLPYHDSLDFHFSKSISWVSAKFNNPAYESLKSYGVNLITNDTIRSLISIYDNGWMETLAERQENYFYNTASPILTKLFDKVAMRTKMKPFDYDRLKDSQEYISILNTSISNREDQTFWYKEWKESLDFLLKTINNELKNN